MPPPTTNVSKPGRVLGVLVLLIVALGAAMWFGGARTPKLALDLSGGTTVTLTAVTEQGAQPSDASMEQAIEIIRSRVNGLGISEAEVSQQGGSNIVVAVPGQGQERVVELVGQTAKLRFRQVLLFQPAGATPTPSPAPTSSPSPSPTGGDDEGSDAEQNGSNEDENASPAASATADAPNRNRALSPALMAQGQAEPTPEPSGGSLAPGATPSIPPDLLQQLQQQQQQQPQQDTSGIDEQVLQKFRELDCSKPEQTRELKDPDKQIAACNREGTAKFVLDKAKVQGTMVDAARAGLPQTGSLGEGWLVQLEFDGEGTPLWADLTQKAYNSTPPRNQVAIVLDGVVVSAPRIETPIAGGNAEITGDFTQQQAQDLANVLKYGALPLTFQKSDITSVSPTLGAASLRGGLIAGAIGMGLVVLYSLLYYRALGMVTVFSLAVAGVMTYQAIVLLGAYLGLRLSLAGVAGLIIGIGITADSFIVYFERLRDEIREGRSLRAAVERAWPRARRTMLLADAVSLMAAVVLFLLAVGGVKGFAFTLGLTTVVDVIVTFLFTKPMVSYLARLRFFGDGHRLSGVDPGRLGSQRPALRRTPREA